MQKKLIARVATRFTLRLDKKLKWNENKKKISSNTVFSLVVTPKSNREINHDVVSIQKIKF